MARGAASSWSVIALALALAVSTCQCQQAGPRLSRHERRIKSHVAAVHNGVQVTVVMKSGSEYRGRVGHMEEAVFWLDAQAQTQPARIAYNDVSKIKSANSNSGSAAAIKGAQRSVLVGAIGCGVILILLFR